MRLNESDNFSLSIEVFISEEGITYPFGKGKPKSIKDAAGVWKPIEELKDMELVHILSKNLMFIGVFKEDNKISSLVLDEKPPNVNLNILLQKDQTIYNVKEIIDEDIPKQETETFDDSIRVEVVNNPEWPLNTIIYEKDEIYPPGDKVFCKNCGSSLKKKLFRRLKGCIQPKCINYWKNH